MSGSKAHLPRASIWCKVGKQLGCKQNSLPVPAFKTTRHGSKDVTLDMWVLGDVLIYSRMSWMF